MTIQVLAFGIVRDIVGGSSLSIELPEQATAADLQILLKEKYPPLSRLASVLVAVNAEYSQGDTPLKEQDEVALIPPVSGG